MFPHRDYYRNESTIRSLPIAIKSRNENSWTSVLIQNTPNSEELPIDFAPFGLQCHPFEPRRVDKRAILKQRCAALCSLNLLVLLFHASNILHYLILPYTLVFRHTIPWPFQIVYYFGILNDIVYFIYATARCKARQRCCEWCYNVFLVVPFWAFYDEVTKRSGLAFVVNDFDVGFFICRCFTAPLRLYWSVKPLRIFQIGEFCPMKYCLRVGLYLFLMLHGGVVVWGVIVLLAQPQYTLIAIANTTKAFDLHYGRCLHFVADLMIQNRQPGPIEPLPNIFIICMSLVCFMFSLYVQGCVFLDRELNNKRLIKLQHFTNNLKQHLRNRRFFTLVPKVAQNHQNVEVYKKSVALDECQQLLRSVNWPLVQDVLFDLNLPALKAGVILGVKHPSADCYLRYLSSKMQREYYNANETVYSANVPMDKMVVLVDGYLDILAEDNATSMMSMAPGTCLGQVALLLNMQCKATIKCVTQVRVLTLSKKHFLTSTLTSFPDVYKQLSRNFQALLTDSKTRKRTVMMRPPQYDVSLAEKASKQLYQVCNISSTAMRHSTFHKTTRIGKVDEDVMLNTGWNIMMVIIGVIVAITYPYYIAFERKFPAGFTIIALPMEILIIVDLVLTLITYEVPKTKQRVFAFNRRFCAKHLWRKLNDWSFYLDFASAIMLEPITFALCDQGDKEQAEFMYYLFKLNRIIKVYKLFHLVWSIHFGNDFYKRLLIHSLSIALMIYYGAVLLYLVSCFEASCKPNGWLRTLQNYEFETGVKGTQTGSPAGTDHKFLSALHASLLHLHSMDVHLGTDPLDKTITLFMCFLGYIYLSFIFIDLACLRYLQLKLMTYYKVDMDDMKKVTVKVAPSLQRRLLGYYRLQWKYDPGYFYHYNYGNYVTKSLGTQIVLAERLETLLKVPVLMSIGKNFCELLAMKSKIYLVAPDDVVTYAGNMNKEMLVLIEGYCKDESGRLVRPLSPMVTNTRRRSSQRPLGQTDGQTEPEVRDNGASAFGMASLFFNLPEEHTITTQTPCLLLSVDGSALQEALLHYPRLNNALLYVLRSSGYHDAEKVKLAIPKHPVPRSQDEDTYGMFYEISKFFARRSFVNVRRYCRERNEVYADPFRKEEIDFVKYFMLPVTIDPWGTFFLGWVVLRAGVGLVLGLTTPFMLISYSGNLQSPLFIVNVFCDVVLGLDACLLAYLAYPKLNGIVVVHPYRTIGHYGGRGLLIDCCLMLPLEWIYRATHDDARMFACIRLLKLAQVYKYFVILVKLRTLEVPMLRRTIEVVKCISWIAILVNTSACVMIATECVPVSTSTDLSGVWLHCNEEGWMRKSLYWKEHVIKWREGNIAPMGQLYSLAVYWSTRLMFGVSFGDLRAQGGYNLLIVVVVLSVGIFLHGFCLQSILSYFLATLRQFKDASRVRGYQVMMQNLLTFLHREQHLEHLEPHTVQKFKDNAIYYWRLTHGINTNKLLSRLHTTVLQDTLCFLYEDTLSQVPLFKSMERAFLRILILIAKPVYFLPQQVIVNQEDVCDRFYIILEGVVHVELARSSYRVNISQASIFGYFSKRTTPVMSIKVTTLDYVHVLCFKSIDYFNILKNYAKFDVELRGVLSEYKDFMPNHAEEQHFVIDSGKNDVAQINTGCLQSLKFYKILDGVLTLFGFANAMLIPFIAILHHWSLIYILIIVDLFFTFVFVLDFVKPFYNDAGLLITDCPVIRKRQLAGWRKILHLCEVICMIIILISYFVYFAPAFPLGWYFGIGVDFAYLRIAAFYRCRYIGNKSFQDIEDDLFIFKIFRIIMILLIVLHWMTCMWVLMQQRIAQVSIVDHQAILIAYINGLLLMMNLFTGGATIRQYYRTECEQIFIAVSLALLTLYRYYSIAKAIAALYLRLKPIFKFNFQLQQLKAYVRSINIDAYQIQHLTTHLIELERREMGKNFPALLKLLPAPLVNELKVQLYKPLLEKSYVFFGTQYNFLRNVAMQLQRAVYFAGEVILHHGEINKCMYFIRDGSVEILTINDNHTETRHDLLQAGEMFGLAQGLFRHHVQHQFTFKAVREVEILTLRLDNWEHLLRHFPSSKETIYNRVRNVERL